MSINQQKLTELVQAAKAGDESAFTVIYHEVVSPIFRFIYFRTKSQQEAQDLTQSVFLKAWLALPRFQITQKPILAWLYTIARNTLTDYWKKKKDLPLNLAEFNIKSNDDLTERIDQKIEFQKVKKALIHLPIDQQEVLIMKFIEELSNQEIATVLDKTEETVRQLQCRGLKALRKNLNKSKS